MAKFSETETMLVLSAVVVVFFTVLAVRKQLWRSRRAGCGGYGRGIYGGAVPLTKLTEEQKTEVKNAGLTEPAGLLILNAFDGKLPGPASNDIAKQQKAIIAYSVIGLKNMGTSSVSKEKFACWSPENSSETNTAAAVSWKRPKFDLLNDNIFKRPEQKHALEALRFIADNVLQQEEKIPVLPDTRTAVQTAIGDNPVDLNALAFDEFVFTETYLKNHTAKADGVKNSVQGVKRVRQASTPAT